MDDDVAASSLWRIYESARCQLEKHIAAYDQWRLILADSRIVTSLHDSRLLDHCEFVSVLGPMEPSVETLRCAMRQLLVVELEHGSTDASSDSRAKMVLAHPALLARCQELRDDASWQQVGPIAELAQTIAGHLHSLTTTLWSSTSKHPPPFHGCDASRDALSSCIASCIRSFFELERVVWRCAWGQSVVEFERRADVASALLQDAILLNGRISSHNDAHGRVCAMYERQIADERGRLDGMVDAYAQWLSSLEARLGALSVQSDIVPTASSLRASIPTCAHQSTALSRLRVEPFAHIEAECKKQLFYKQMMDGRRSILANVVYDVTSIALTGSWWTIHHELSLIHHRLRTVQWATYAQLVEPALGMCLRVFYKRLMALLSLRVNARLDGEYGGRVIGERRGIRSVVDYKRALYATVGRFASLCRLIRQMDGLVLAGRQDRVLRDYQRRLEALHASEVAYLHDKIKECRRRCEDYACQIRHVQQSQVEPIEKSVQLLHLQRVEAMSGQEAIDRATAELEQVIERAAVRRRELAVLLSESTTAPSARPCERESHQVELATLSASIEHTRVHISTRRSERATLVQSQGAVDRLCTRMSVELQRCQVQIDSMRDARSQLLHEHDRLRHLQQRSDQLHARMAEGVSAALGCIALPRFVLPIETPLFASTSEPLDVGVTVENTTSLTSIVAEVVSMRTWRSVHGRWVASSSSSSSSSNRTGCIRLTHEHAKACGEMTTFRFPFHIHTPRACRVECTVVVRLQVKVGAGVRIVRHTHTCTQFRTESLQSHRRCARSIAPWLAQWLVVLLSCGLLFAPRWRSKRAR